MPYIHIDTASEFTEEAKHEAARIVYQHFRDRDKYDSEDKFIAELVEKIVNRVFLTNARYTEQLVMKMLEEAFREK